MLGILLVLPSAPAFCLSSEFSNSSASEKREKKSVGVIFLSLANLPVFLPLLVLFYPLALFNSALPHSLHSTSTYNMYNLHLHRSRCIESQRAGVPSSSPPSAFIRLISSPASRSARSWLAYHSGHSDRDGPCLGGDLLQETPRAPHSRLIGPA